MFRHWPGTVLVPVLACCHQATSHCLNQYQQIIRKSFGQFQCSKCSRYLFLIWYKIINSSLQLHITGLNGLSYCVACGICILYRTTAIFIDKIWWYILFSLVVWLKHTMDLCVLLCSSRLCMWMSCSTRASTDTVLDMYFFQTRMIALWLRAHWFPSVFICSMFISHIDPPLVGPFHGMSIFPLIHTVV